MPNVLIVGGGKIGFHLASQLVDAGYAVTVLDRESASCGKIARELKAIAIQGDGTEIEALGEADTVHADYVVAATGRDEDNLAVCRIAKERYGCHRVIARVINPKNEALYRISGADAVIDPTTMAASRIRDALPAAGMRLLSLFESADLSMAEIEIRESAPAVGRAVSELHLPAECVLIALVRAGRALIIRGGTTISAGDRVYALVAPASMALLQAILAGGATK